MLIDNDLTDWMNANFSEGKFHSDKLMNHKQSLHGKIEMILRRVFNRTEDCINFIEIQQLH